MKHDCEYWGCDKEKEHGPTPQEKSTCCEACETTHQIGGAPKMICNCVCHTSPADTKVEDWAAEFIATFYVYNLKKDTPAGAEKEAVAFIKNLIEKVRQEANESGYQEGLRVAAQKVEGENFTSYQKGLQEGIKMERDRWEQIYAWLNGSSITDLFPERKSGEGAYWWRKPLRERVERIINPPSHPSV
jgi:hypothetical protein